MIDLEILYRQSRRILLAGLLVSAASAGWAALSPQNMSEIQSGMQTIELFSGLPLGGDPGDLACHWEALLRISQLPAWNVREREMQSRALSGACFGELKKMNAVLAADLGGLRFKNVDERRVFAVRYYHLLYFIFQYYRVMGWGWDVINADFATTGWPDAADCRWQANAARLREWLGGSAQLPSTNGASTGLALPVSQNRGMAGGRSVREIESAIRRQQSYIRELERKLDRASSDYSSYKDNERRRIANGGRVSRAGISGGKLRTVQMFERLLRENERTLERLQAELDVARACEEKATAVMESTSTEKTSSAEPKSNRFCTECGAKAAKDAKFCGACGRKL